MADLLMALFYIPTRHLGEYSRLLLKLATCFEVVRGSSGNKTIYCVRFLKIICFGFFL